MLKGLFLFVLVMTVIVGAILIYTEYYEGEDVVCVSPNIKSGSGCCLDADYNNVCDSKQLQETIPVDNVMEKVTDANQITTLRNRIVALEDNVEYYKRVIVQLTNERDYYERLYREERADNRDSSEDEWDLRVIVEDEDGFDIEDAYVRIENGDTKIKYTDEDGEAVFRNIKEDCYEVRVRADGYITEVDDICVDDDDSIRFRLELD